MYCDICCEEIWVGEKYLTIKEYRLNKKMWAIGIKGKYERAKIYCSICCERNDVMPYGGWYECKYVLPEGIYSRFEILDI